MSARVRIVPYESVDEDGKAVTFGMTQDQLDDLNWRVYSTLRDNTCDWSMQRRAGIGMEFVAGQLVAVRVRLDPSGNRIQVAGDDCSSIEAIDKLRSGYEHHVFSDGLSVLFPALGILYSVGPFRSGFEAPRPGVVEKEVVAFSQDRLEHYRNASRVLTLEPLSGVSVAGGKAIQFGMTRAEIRSQWGEEELLWDDSGVSGMITEYRFSRGLSLTYGRETSQTGGSRRDYHLRDVSVMEREGWQVDVGGVRVFQDERLTQMTDVYEHIDSKDGKLTLFPGLGLLAVGCGDKKNRGEGKQVVLSNKISWLSLLLEA